MPRPGRLLGVVALCGLSMPAAASAATKLVSYESPTPIAAYRDTVAWSAFDPASRRYTLSVWQGREIRALPIPPQVDSFDAAVGRGPDGRPLIVYGDCPAGGRCGVYGFDLAQSRGRLLAASTRPRVRPYAPSVWRDRVVWAESIRRPVVYVARTNGGKPRVVRRLGGRYVGATALLGQELALDVGPATENGEETIQVQRLDGTRRHVVGHTTSGEAQQTFVGLSFSGDALYWSRVCHGDPSGCASGGKAYRYRRGKYAHARVPGDLAGFAVASTGAYWVTEYIGDCDPASEGETCDVVHESLHFKPGHDSHDGP